METTQYGWRENSVASYSDIECTCASQSCVNNLASPSREKTRIETGGSQHTISGFIKTMSRIAMTGEDCDFVTKLLQANSCVNDQAFRSADTEIRVYEDDVAPLRWVYRLQSIRLRSHDAAKLGNSVYR